MATAKLCRPSSVTLQRSYAAQVLRLYHGNNLSGCFKAHTTPEVGRWVCWYRRTYNCGVVMCLSRHIYSDAVLKTTRVGLDDTHLSSTSPCWISSTMPRLPYASSSLQSTDSDGDLTTWNHYARGSSLVSCEVKALPTARCVCHQPGRPCAIQQLPGVWNIPCCCLPPSVSDSLRPEGI